MSEMGRGVRWLLLIAVAAVGGLTHQAFAQEETDLGEETRQAAQALAQARAAYDEADFSQAIVLLNRLLDEQGVVAPGVLAVEEVGIIADALKLRGISFFNMGETRAAEEDFARVLSIDPEIELDTQLVSPKIVEAFKKVRNRTTSLLSVLSDPPGSDVRIGDRLLGATPLEDVRVTAGDYVVTVSRAGYANDRQTVEIAPGKRISHQVSLVRDSRTVSLMTVPAGARILVDGDPAGRTEGAAPPGFGAMLLDRGIEPTSASAPVLLPYLSAGEHLLRVEKDCHQPFEATFTVLVEDSDMPLQLEPVVLDESIGSLMVDSLPAGAQVLVDGRVHGTTPAEVPGLCAGTHEVKVAKPGVGRWWGTVELRSDERRRVMASLRPTLATLGSVRQFGTTDPDADRWDAILRRIVVEQTAYNLVPDDGPDGQSGGDLRWDIYNRLEGEARTRDLGDDVLRTVQSEVEADLFMVAVPRSDGGAQILLYGARQGHPDQINIDGEEKRAVASLVERLSAPTKLTEGWSGLMTVETAGSSFPHVLSVSPLAPEGTTVRAGDRVQAVAGVPTTSRNELEAAFRDRRPGLPLNVTVERAGQVAEAIVVTAETPVFPAAGDPGLLVNKYLADLYLAVASTSDDKLRSLAEVGIGLAYLNVDRFDRAHSEGFARARLQRPAGVNQGTVFYLSGLAYERRGAGFEKQAEEAFRQALSSPGSTLRRDDGLPVAPFAAARIRDLDEVSGRR